LECTVPDAEHPLGYGKVSYFWSFVVAVILFTLGGLYSIYEGWHKLQAPVPPQSLWVAQLVLLVAIVLEGFSMYGCMVEVNKLRRGRSLLAWLDEARSAELVVVFGEDLAALLGLVVALAFLTLAGATGEGRYDAYGSIAVGVILLAISIFVAVRVKALLIGRSADPEIVAAIEEFIAAEGHIHEVLNVITFQMGPQIMLAAKVRLDGATSVRTACEHINALERRLKERFPEMGWCFVEPDIVD
jgi:divalent metal cation (Fe/Co/Zn/Cd) transporter